ncbi:MAG: response regulator [Desulfomonilaceae bacterium]|nr:response regulator [Desulfomonilaceae bacterium]
MATILILDAERDSRLLFKRFLEQEGYAVIACDDQRHALDLAGTNKVDLAIVNADTGRRNTTPVGQLLKTENKGLRILVITDFLHDECKQIMSEQEVLLRPVEMETVGARVRELLRSPPPSGR